MMENALLPAGKLPGELLDRLLRQLGGDDKRLVVGPRTGEDAAVIEMGDHFLIAKSDPITFATGEIGWYAVNVNANDVAMMGGTPRWFLATLLLPAGKATAQMAEAIFGQLREACAALGVTLAGGHTEITHQLDRPLLCGTMLGEVAHDRLITTAGAQVGDSVVLVKCVPIEGTALMALERADYLAGRGYERTFVERAQRYLHDPGISVVAPARLACDHYSIHSMHDPTEGGVATGLTEIARAAGVGLQIALDRIPIAPEGARLCAEFGLDPLGTIASGAILLTLPANQAEALRATLAKAGYPSSVIGSVMPSGYGCQATRNENPAPWPTFSVDEITRVF
jgi:hydrogenase expression/formation protein HypE